MLDTTSRRGCCFCPAGWIPAPATGRPAGKRHTATRACNRPTGCGRGAATGWTQLDEALLADPRPALLAAHSLGCHLVAAWAAHSRHTSARCAAALLVAPPDLDRPDTPPQITGWRPVARQRLPFPALLACSDDDPFCSLAASEQLATGWGAATWLLPARGHLNAESGLGDWPEALQRLRGLAGHAR